MKGLIVASLCAAETMMQYLMEGDVVEDLLKSSKLAAHMDKARLESLMAEATGGLILVLPTNAAWEDNEDIYAELTAETPKAAKLRHDLMFAAGGEMDQVGGFDVLLDYASQNDGVVDTAYGTPIKINEDGSVCIAEYDSDWNLVTGECAQLRIPPLMFDDGSLYMTDKIILPQALWSEIRGAEAD